MFVIYFYSKNIDRRNLKYSTFPHNLDDYILYRKYNFQNI